MHNSLKKVTLWHIFWFLIYITPFLAWLFMSITNSGIQVTSRSGMDGMFIGWQYVIDKNNIFLNWFVDVYKIISQHSNFELGNNMESFLLISCYWVLMVSFFRIIVDLALFIPRICHNMIHKLSRERGNEL